jgi:GNAT superfamily N-acetyltransferase
VAGGPEEITLRWSPRRGDLGTVLAMHGRVYAAEYGFDLSFEAHVAAGLAQFASRLALADSPEGAERVGRLWIAERAGVPLGTLGLTSEDGFAMLRWFLVEPAARGAGAGRNLLGAALAHARAGGHRRVRLWTVSGLAASARLYADAGFAVTARERVRKWGVETEEIVMELPLG